MTARTTMGTSDEVLRVWSNGTDTVVARDIEDAWAVWSEHSGEKREDYDDGDVWTEVARSIRIWCNANGEISDGGDGDEAVEMTAEQWARKNGRGFLCSTEI